LVCELDIEEEFQQTTPDRVHEYRSVRENHHINQVEKWGA
jgi:hypothetical protein